MALTAVPTPGPGSALSACSATPTSSPSHQGATVGPHPATALSHRAHESGDAEGSDSESEVPSSWRQRDRESRRVFRGVCGECGRNVFTDQVHPAGHLRRRVRRRPRPGRLGALRGPRLIFRATRPLSRLPSLALSLRPACPSLLRPSPLCSHSAAVPGISRRNLLPPRLLRPAGSHHLSVCPPAAPDATRYRGGRRG